MQPWVDEPCAAVKVKTLKCTGTKPFKVVFFLTSTFKITFSTEH